MRSLLLALATVGILGASAASAAPPIRAVTPPAPPSLAGLPVSSSNGAKSAIHWTQVGPNYFPGRFNCVGSDILNLPVIAAGSDGSGYWWGYALADFPGNMHQRGKELGGGVRQITHRLNFPEEGGYYQVVTVIRTDGSLAYSIDDGATFNSCTLNLPDGYTVATARQLGYDSGSINVDYALVYGTDDIGNEGVLMLRSFDGGQTFDFTDFRQTQRAHLWSSRQGSGEIVLVWSDGENAHVELNNGLADPNSWTEVSSIPSPFGGIDSDSILVAAQENENTDSLHIWVHFDGTLFRTTDGGQNWTNVREYTTGSERSLGTSLLHKDLVLWGTGDHTVFYSTDGGTTPQQISTDWPEQDAIEGRSVNIDCWSWDFLPAKPQYAVRVPNAAHSGTGTLVTRTLPEHAVRRDTRAAASPNGAGVPQEWIYFSTGQGVFSWRLENTSPQLLARFGVVTQQITDLVTLRTGVEKYAIVAATRDAGVTGMTSGGGPVPDAEGWNSLILSYNNDIGHVLTSKKPEAGDPVMFSDFPFGGITTYGSGLFTGTGVNTGTARHPAMSSDPVGPYRFWVVSDALYRETYNRTTNTFTEAVIPAPVGGTDGQGTAFAIAPSNNSRWYLANALGRLYYSTNSGATWTLGTASGGGPLPSGTVGDVVGDVYEAHIVVNPTNALEAWAIGTRVLRTTNGGATWAPFGINLPPDVLAYGLAYDPTGVYLATNRGPYWLNGAVWTDLAPANGEMPAVECRCVESLPWAGVVRFGTWGLGVWDYATGATAGVDGGPKPALALALAMRSNPVHDLARLDYTLPRAGRMTLELLDVQGRLVDRLVDGVQPAGSGSATIDAQGIGAGVYFARLVTTDGTRTARVVVLH